VYASKHTCFTFVHNYSFLTFAKEMEVSYESVPVIEEWMTVPFKDGFMEPDMHMESWMTAAWI
jgi:hypothetical protein